MEILGEVHPVLEGIIMDAALKAVDSLLAKVRLQIIICHVITTAYFLSFPSFT